MVCPYPKHSSLAMLFGLIWMVFYPQRRICHQTRHHFNWTLIVMDLRSMEIAVFSGEVIPLCRRLGSRVAALGA
jgi:tryptophan-rich sensory protein